MALLTKAGSFTRPAAGTTNTVVSGLGFKPAAVLLFASNALANTTWRNVWEQAVGWIAPVLTNPSVATVEMLRSYAVNGSTADYQMALDAGVGGGATPTATAGAATLDANGFTIDWLNSPYDAEQEIIGYLAIGGDAKAATARAEIPEIGAGAQFQMSHALGFIPSAALVSVLALDTPRSQSFGVVAGAGQWATGLAAPAATGAQAVRRRLSSARGVFLMQPSDGTTLMDAIATLSRAGLSLAAQVSAAFQQSYSVAPAGMVSPTGQMSFSHDRGLLLIADPGANQVWRIVTSTGAKHANQLAISSILNNVQSTAPNAPDAATTVALVDRDDFFIGARYSAAQTYPTWRIIGGTVGSDFGNPEYTYVYSAAAGNSPRGAANVGKAKWVYTDPQTQQFAYTSIGESASPPAPGFPSTPKFIGGGSGTANGKFTGINRIAFDGTHLYVTDYAQNRVQKFLPIYTGTNMTGATWVATWGGTGSGDGQLSNPHDVAIGPDGDVWVADTNNQRVCRFSNTGVFKESLATGGKPTGLQVGPDGAVYTLNWDTKVLRKWTRGSNRAQAAVLYLGGMMAEAGVATKPTGAAPATQAIAASIKSQALFLGTVSTTTVDTATTGWRQSFGADDGATRAAVAAVAQTGVATGNADSLAVNSRSLVVADNDTPTMEASAAVAWSAKKPTVTWNTNNAVATRYGYLALGQSNFLQAYGAGEAVAFGRKLGNNLQFSARVRAEALAAAQGFGNVGNWPGSNVAQAYLVATGTGLGFDRNFTGLVEAAAQVVTPGFGFNRQFTALVTAEALASVRRLGNGVWEGSAKVEAAGFASAVGFGFDRNFTALGRAALNSEAYFEIQLPAPRTALPDELPGTVNWVLNPSVEFTSGTLGWEAEEGATIARVVSEQGSWDGAAGLKVETPGDLAGEGFHVESVTGLELTGYREDGRVRRVVGQVRLRADSGTVAGLVYVTRRFYQDGTSETTDPVELPELTTNWWRLETSTVDLDPEKVMVRIEVAVLTAAAQESVFWADGAQIEEDIGQGASSWVTGSYGADTGVWAGAANQSMSVRQPLPAIVRGIGRGGAVVVESVMYESDQNNVFQRVLEKTVIDAKVTMDSGRSSTWKLDATMTLKGYRDLRPNETWLSPWLKVTYPDGTVLEGQLGHYLMVPSEQERFEYGGKVKVAAYDALWLMDRQEMGDILTLPPNTNYSTALRSILQEMRMPDGTRMKRFTIPDSQYLIGDAVAWEEDTSRLKAANELAEAGALYPLATDAVGWISTKRMGNERLAAQAPVKAWAANLDDQASINEWIPRIAAVKSEVVGAVTISPRALDFVDKIIVASVNPKAGELRVQADIVGSPDQDARAQIRGFPYANTGGRRTINNPLIANPAAAQQIAFTIADQLTARVEHAKISVLPDPSIDYLRGTAVLGIWDAYQDPVVVGLYAIRRVSFGFTPSTCLQTIDLDYVGAGENQIVIKTA